MLQWFSFCAIYINQDSLIELIRRTRMHFINCILPQHNAGLCEQRAAAPGPPQQDVMLNVPLVRSQVRGAEIVEAVRLHRHGMLSLYRLFHLTL